MGGAGKLGQHLLPLLGGLWELSYGTAGGREHITRDPGDCLCLILSSGPQRGAPSLESDLVFYADPVTKDTLTLESSGTRISFLLPDCPQPQGLLQLPPYASWLGSGPPTDGQAAFGTVPRACHHPA